MLEKRESWRGPHDYSKCRPVRTAIHATLKGLPPLHTADYGGYNRTNLFEISTRRYDAQAVYNNVLFAFFGEVELTPEVIDAKRLLLEHVEEALRSGKPSPKAMRRLVHNALGSDWMKANFNEKALGDLGETLSSAGWRRMACWLTPETEGPPEHYANKRSCWWGMQGQGEAGRRKCFSRCRFKAAGGFFLLGKFIPENANLEEVPISIQDQTDIRVSIVAIDYSGRPIPAEDANVGLPWALFNTYDRLSTSGWETDKTRNRNRWIAEQLGISMSLRWWDVNTDTAEAGRDTANGLEFETNYQHSPILWEGTRETRPLKAFAPKLYCTCRRDYISKTGSASECRAENVPMHADNPHALRLEEQPELDERDDYDEGEDED